MQRRKFLKAFPLAIGGVTLQAYASTPLLSIINNSLINTDHILVIVQLSGGNDGLNTVIPLDQYSQLSKFRSNVLIPESKVLSLSGTGGKTGLHPALTRFQELWNENKLAIINGVGYPNFSFSHFRATDIWMTGSDANEFLSSGWAGRYLNYEYPNFPVGYPNSAVPDPLAIRIGSSVGLGLQYAGQNMGISIASNGANDTSLSSNIFKDAASSSLPVGKELLYVREVQRQSDKYGDTLTSAYSKGKNVSSLYVSNSTERKVNELSKDLSTVAKLISGGLQTRIYWVEINGFDTHKGQVNAADTTTGDHATLLKGVADSIYAFLDDMKQQGFGDRITGMTFSEFGRRIQSNASIGTDHGSAIPMFLFGNKIKTNFIGNNPIIDPNTTVSTNLAMQYDYRSVYASILNQWFCVPEADLDDILLKDYQRLPLLNGGNCLSTSTQEVINNTAIKLEASPNPFTERFQIRYSTTGGNTQLHVFDAEGRLIKTLLNSNLGEGEYSTECDLGDAPSGLYYIRLQNKSLQQVQAVSKVK